MIEKLGKITITSSDDENDIAEAKLLQRFYDKINEIIEVVNSLNGDMTEIFGKVGKESEKPCSLCGAVDERHHPQCKMLPAGMKPVEKHEYDGSCDCKDCGTPKPPDNLEGVIDKYARVEGMLHILPEDKERLADKIREWMKYTLYGMGYETPVRVKDAEDGRMVGYNEALKDVKSKLCGE